MRKRRNLQFKTMMCLLLSGCMVFGSFTTPTYADGTEAQVATVEESQTTEESVVENGTEADETQVENTETVEENNEASVEDTEVEEDSEAAEDAGIATYALNMPTAAVTNTSKVTAVKLKTPENSDDVWGTGILTGSTDLDDKSWVKGTETNRGYDNSQSNDIIRSFDSIYYSVSSTFDLDKTTEHTLVYEVTLPDDDELVLDEDKMNATKPIECVKNNDGTKTYNCKYPLEVNYAGGEKTENIIIKVGGKKQDDTIRPTIKAYLDSTATGVEEVKNMETVTVTTAPFLNIVLKKKTNEQYANNFYNFAEADTQPNNYHYKNNAAGYKDNKVNGYRITYGVGLEITKPGGGIKGVEIPDSKTGVTFDVDISNATLAGYDGTNKDLEKEGFGPLLFYVGPNKLGGGAVTALPLTADSNNDNYPNMGCYNSGNIKVEQVGTKLKFEIKDFVIDQSKFPKQNVEKQPYWTDENKKKEGMFSVYQFQLVYPYDNDKSQNIQEKLGDGTINVSAKVENIKATSITGTSITEETNLDDNEQSGTWSLISGNGRNQQIFYSDRSNITQPYTSGQINTDSDVAAVGADNLAFTIQYGQNNASDAGKRSDLPVAVEQFVLFDRSAITNVKFSKRQELSVTEDKYGYDCTVLYAVRRAGRMDNDAMRTAKLEDFDFYDTPQKNCDGVLIKYKGMNLGDKTEMGLYAQFNADINTDTSIEKKVYMITAFTNVWTAGDFESEILSSLGKSSLKDVSRKELSTWARNNLDVTKAGYVNSQLPKTNSTIDNRTTYTVPEYKDNEYSADKNHKFNRTWADGLYIVPYTTTITKTVAQLDTKGEPMQRYNIGGRQKYVDYKIASSIKYEASVDPVEGSKTNVYIEDTLPKGLTYIKDSAYLGGTYKSNFPDQGSVTGGEKIDPTVTNNEDGTTTLKWTIKDVQLKNGQLEDIHYSCEIDSNTEADTSLKNTVTIQTTEDKRPIAKESYNTSDATVTVTKSDEFYIKKSGNASLELNDEASYTLEAANTSASDKTNLCVFDTMPYNDEQNGQFKGNYEIKSLTMDAKAVNHATDMEIWYTNNKYYIGKTANEISASEITEANGWKKADATGHEGDTITFTGDGLIGNWPTVIAYKDENLKMNTSAILKLEYKAVAATQGDNFVNQWTTMSNNKQLRDYAHTDVYNRTIEGTVWYDKNQDGLIDDSEKKLEGVKVTLLVKNKNNEYVPYTPYAEKTEDGVVQPTTENPLNVTYTDKDGHYKFSALPEGEYQIKFESANGTDLGNYEVTKKDASDDVTKTSKVDPKNGTTRDENDKLSSGKITDITMPSLEQMVNDNKGENPKGTTYNLPDQNLGLITTRDIKVTKVWNDSENKFGNRPDSIEVILLANGKDITDKNITSKMTLNAANNWTGTFTNLPKLDDDLNEIDYSVKEIQVTGYHKGEVTGDMTNGFTITNSPETTSITVTKKWDGDNNNADNNRPSQIKVKLYAKIGDKVVTDDSIPSELIIKPNEQGEWIGKVDNLPKYKNGKEINYTVEEENVPFYTYEKTEGSASTGYIITNKYTPEKVTIPVNKVWDDNDNQDGIRPDSVTVRLYADGNKTDNTLTLSEKNKWNAEFKNLDAYKNGKKITYTVQEDKEDNKDNNKDKLEGYESSISKDGATGTFTITNTHAPAVTSVAVTKSWNDNNNQYNNRPDKITVKLLADNKEITDKSITSELELTKDGNWIGTFTDLPKYKAGKEIKYTVKEVPVAGYTSEITGKADTGFTITNTTETTSVAGSKTWNDGDDQDGIRPTSIKINLLANDDVVEYKTVTASKDGKWSWKFTNLTTYRNGVKVTYTITEDEVAGYTSAITGDDATGYTVTNTHTPETVEVAGSKTWDDNDNQDGKRPEKITIRLFADGKEVNKKDVTAADNWTWKFENLPKNSNGKEITYTIKEDAVDGYTTAIDGYSVTNTHTPEIINISGSKTWNDANNQDGKRPDSITINLLKNGEISQTKEVKATDDWKWSFNNLPKYENGAAIIYTITENAVPNYETQIEGYNVTNSYTPGKTSLKVTKDWNDANNQDGIRSKTVSVHLYKTTDSTKEPVDTGKVLTLSESNGWTGYFSELNMYEAGKAITYSVKEDKVEGYTSEITGDAATGYTITNTHTPETINITGKKTWDDSDNQDGKRSDKITVRLLANGTEVANKEVSETDNWTWTFENLAKNAGGKAIVYTVTEDAVKDYTTTVTGDATRGFEVTNTYKPGKVSVSVTKAWDDNNDQDGIRPETIKIHLYADGKDTGKELTLTAKDNWSGSFTDLDECKAGNRIAYTITEDEVEGYTSAITGDAEKGYVVTNTHTPTTPEEPENPQTPQEPTTPETPQTPGTPTNPSTPVTPQNPTTPSTPDTKTQQPQQPQDVKKTTKTGDTTNPLPWLVLFITPFGILAERLRRRKNK